MQGELCFYMHKTTCGTQLNLDGCLSDNPLGLLLCRSSIVQQEQRLKRRTKRTKTRCALSCHGRRQRTAKHPN